MGGEEKGKGGEETRGPPGKQGRRYLGRLYLRRRVRGPRETLDEMKLER